MAASLPLGFLRLRQGCAWPAAQSGFRELHDLGYALQDDADGTVLESAEWLGRREIVLSRRGAGGDEVGLAYFGFDREGHLQAATLTWRAGAAPNVEAFEYKASTLFLAAAALLGPPQGVLLGAPEGLSAIGDADVVVAQAFWPHHARNPGAAAATHRGRDGCRSYQAALADAGDAATAWLVADAWRDGARLHAVFSPFRSNQPLPGVTSAPGTAWPATRYKGDDARVINARGRASSQSALLIDHLRDRLPWRPVLPPQAKR